MEGHNPVLQILITGITNGCIYAIVAIGFSIIYSSTQVINFAQGEFVMIGAMVAAVLLAKFGLAVAFPVAILAAVLAGIFVALCVLFPLKRASHVTLIIITVGASIMLRGLAQLFWGETAIPVKPFTGVEINGYIEHRTFDFFGTALRAQEIWVVAVTAILVIGMHVFFKYTMIGQAMRACSSNPDGAKITGIGVKKMVVLSFVLAAALGAVAGVTVSPVFYAKCTMGTALGLKGFCAAVLGGLGNFGGGVFAGLILGIVEALGGLYISDYKDAVAFVILLIILLVKPDGILSKAKAKKV